jgi:UDPglucose--hexose-1-phosphate uridylyltransferase
MLKHSEIRKHYLVDKYVIITPGRAARPRDIKEETVITRTGDCPFCPARIDKKNVIDEIRGDNGQWQVLGLNNLFPAVTLDNDRAYGAQEVIVETPDHEKELAHLTETEIALVLKMFARRTTALMANPKLEYILCFKNQGSKAGASIVHAHSQILATHILPPDIHTELGLAQSYRVEKGACPYCDIMKREMGSERRIWEDTNVAAFTPYASDYHYEAWIFTKRHLDNITKLEAAEFASLARALKKILLKLDSLDLSFNFFLHQVVSDHDQHFYLKIQPRASVWAGFEQGSGLVINSIPPEEAARYYRE